MEPHPGENDSKRALPGPAPGEPVSPAAPAGGSGEGAPAPSRPSWLIPPSGAGGTASAPPGWLRPAQPAAPPAADPRAPSNPHPTIPSAIPLPQIPATPPGGEVAPPARPAPFPSDAATPSVAAPPAPEATPPPASAAAPSAGAETGAARRLGPYVVEASLARGGMGEVLLAFDPGLNRRVAIKTIARALLDEPGVVERFRREARATAAVAHPAIAGIYYVGADEEGLPFIAMEYIDGVSLYQVIRDRMAVPYSTLCDWMIQTCEGLQAAQKADIIHRDLKPANLMITRKGEVKIVDFGLAKIFREDTLKTRTGMVLGTPQYMSPEQGQGRALDHRSDIYSLGATFYHALTGRPPFDGENLVDVMMRHVTTPLTPVYSVNPNVPLPLCDMIHRMMAKNPAERPQDYEELIADLKAVKLELLSKEKGGFIGAPWTPPLAPASAPSGLGTAAPPFASPAGPFSGGAGAQAAGASGVVIHSMKVESPAAAALPAQEESGAGPMSVKRMILISAAILAGLLCVLTIVLNFVKEKPEPPPEAAPGPKSGLGVALSKLASAGAQPTPVPMPEDLEAARATLDALQTWSGALLTYETEKGHFPRDLRDVVDAEMIDEALLLDGWSQPFQLRPVVRSILSYGADGQEDPRDSEGGDDLMVEAGSTPLLPAHYEEMKQEWLERQRALRGGK